MLASVEETLDYTSEGLSVHLRQRLSKDAVSWLLDSPVLILMEYSMH